MSKTLGYSSDTNAHSNYVEGTFTFLISESWHLFVLPRARPHALPYICAHTFGIKIMYIDSDAASVIYFRCCSKIAKEAPTGIYSQLIKELRQIPPQIRTQQFTSVFQYQLHGTY